MQCMKRGDGPSCTYPSATRSDHVIDHGERTSEAQLRLRKLEVMVNSLVGNKPVSENFNGEEEALRDYDRRQEGQQRPPGIVPGDHLESDGAEYNNYLGATQWQAVLQNVSFRP